MPSTLGFTFLMAASSLGCGDHHPRRVEVVTVCDPRAAEVAREIAILRTAPRWRARDDAAHRLAKYDWKRSPEILPALVEAMARDPEDEVREEAAESLGKIAPCVPEVHEGLKRAANCDPDTAVRKQARKSLKELGDVCKAPCGACDPGLVIERRVIGAEPVFVDPGQPAIPVEELPPGTIVVPPTELPAPLPGTNPFSEAARRPKASPAKVAQSDLIIRRAVRPRSVPNTRR